MDGRRACVPRGRLVVERRALLAVSSGRRAGRPRRRLTDWPAGWLAGW